MRIHTGLIAPTLVKVSLWLAPTFTKINYERIAPSLANSTLG